MKIAKLLFAGALALAFAACGQKTDNAEAAQAEVAGIQATVDSLTAALEAAQVEADSIAAAEFDDEAVKQTAIELAQAKVAEIASQLENEEQNLAATIEKYAAEGVDLADETQSETTSVVDEIVDSAKTAVSEAVSEAVEGAEEKASEAIDEAATEAATKAKESVSNLLKK